MLDEANGDLEKFKAKVETHFNEVMDRVGGWYKRRAQAAMFIIGFVFAVLFNVDSIYIVQQLQRNPEVVEKLVQIAEKTSETAKVQNKNANPPPPNNKDLLDEVKKLNNQIHEFKNSGLPIGWTHAEQKSNSSLTGR